MKTLLQLHIQNVAQTIEPLNRVNNLSWSDIANILASQLAATVFLWTYEKGGSPNDFKERLYGLIHQLGEEFSPLFNLPEDQIEMFLTEKENHA